MPMSKKKSDLPSLLGKIVAIKRTHTIQSFSISIKCDRAGAFRKDLVKMMIGSTRLSSSSIQPARSQAGKYLVLAGKDVMGDAESLTGGGMVYYAVKIDKNKKLSGRVASFSHSADFEMYIPQEKLEIKGSREIRPCKSVGHRYIAARPADLPL